MRGRHRRGTWALSLCFAVAILSHAHRQAEAYCRTSTCSAEKLPLCTPPQTEPCGIPLFWNRDCIGISMQRDASRQVDLASATAVVRQAFDAWENADCGDGETPGIRVLLTEPVSCNAVEYSTKGNANIVVFRDDAWPHEDAPNELALATISFNTETGEIYDADIEVNTANYTFTLSDDNVETDLLAVLTHEAGHVLGLAHTSGTEATMYKEYMMGDISIRTLDQDDIDGICAASPPKAESNCDSTPRHGFLDTCSDEVVDEGCDCSVARSSSRSLPRWWLALLPLLLRVSRRKRRT